VGPRDLSLLALIAALSPGQEPPAPPSFPASVEQVVVDAVVLDETGAAVTGLSRDDFLVAEDGRPQAVASFEAVEVRDEAKPAPVARAGVASNAAPASVARRTLVIVFDDLGLDPARGERARTAVGAFVRTEARDGDQLALVSTSGGARWVARTREELEDLLDVVARLRGLRVSDPPAERMTETEACRVHVQRDGRTTALVIERYQASGMAIGRGIEQLVAADAAAACQRATTRARQVLEVLGRCARSLQGVRGRKAVVLVSPGFLEDAAATDYQRVREACREANVAVYFLNAAGLEAPPTSLAVDPPFPFRAPGAGEEPPSTEPGTRQENLAGAGWAPDRDAAAGGERVADDTGGFVVRDTNDLAGGLRRVARDARAYYLLGYVSTNAARDGRYHKITVRLSPRAAAGRERWKVRARRGYNAPTEAGPGPTPSRVEDELQRVLDSPVGRGDLPLRVAAYTLEDSPKEPGAIRCRVVTELDPRTLAAAGGRPADAGVDVAYETLPRDGGPGERLSKRVKPSAAEGRDWLTVLQDLAVSPGVHRLTVAARDAASGRFGSVSVRLDVPPTRAFRVSTPVVSPAGPAGAAPATRAAGAADREFTPADHVQVAFAVYGARSDPGSGGPRLSVSYAVVPAGDGTSPARFTRVASDATGAFQPRVEFGAAELAPGPFLFVGRVVDEVAGRQVTFTEPFTVASAPEVPAAAAPSAPAAADPELAALLERAGRYVVEYEGAFHDIAAEEEYSQRAPHGDPNLPDWVRTRADVVFARLAPPFPWASYRDVYEVNGSPVRDRDGRLERAFRESPATALARAQAILAESTRYNIGPERTVNLPTLALLILHPANQSRFAFEGKGRKGTAVEVSFREQARPTIFREFTESRRQVPPGSARSTDRGGDLPVEGRFSLDPARGTVLRSEVHFRFADDAMARVMTKYGGIGSDARATITTTYRAEPGLAIWVPVEMKERYEGGAFGYGTDAVARYSRFRKFEVTVEQGGARVAPP
jgi:VWFA-related protein